MRKRRIIKVDSENKINIENLNWFNIKNYTKLDELDRVTLYHILDYRRAVTRLISDGNEEIAEISFINCCLNYDFKTAIYIKAFGGTIVSKELKINQLSFNDLSRGMSSINEFCDQQEFESDEVFNMLFGAVIGIDLSVNDELLVEQFKNWLKNKREENQINISKRLSDNTFLKVKQYKIIPYIDLLLWGELTKNSLTYKEQANLLYSDDLHKDGEYVRNTIKPFAEKLLYADINLI